MRVVGTAIGAAVALLLIQFSTSIVFFVVLASLGMIFSFSLLERNYTTASFAITISVIFAFALLDPNLYTVIQFRFIDTVLAAIVSIAVAYGVFPLWEFQLFQKNVTTAMQANQLYFQEIFNFFTATHKDDTAYRLKRKKAFLESSQLNANFQRFQKDPKSKQHQHDAFYELVTINHTLVATLTHLGNYLKERNIPKLHAILSEIWSDLDATFDSILKKEIPEKQVSTSYKKLHQYWQTLETKRNREYDAGAKIIAPDFKQELQEVQLLQQEVTRIRELLESIHKLTYTTF
jgi:uncharacterized membrane protein YccC